MAPQAHPGSFSDSATEIIYWKNLALSLEDEVVDKKQAYEELKRYEAEMERELTDLKTKSTQWKREVDTLKAKLNTIQNDTNDQINTLQRENETLRKSEASYKQMTRDLEIQMEELENAHRMIDATIRDLQSKNESLEEEKIMLQQDFEDRLELEQHERAMVQEQYQRLKDELRETHEELSVVRSKGSFASLDSGITTVNPQIKPSWSTQSVDSMQSPLFGISEEYLGADLPNLQQQRYEYHTASAPVSRRQSVMNYSFSRSPPRRSGIPTPTAGAHRALSSLSELLERAQALEAKLASVRERFPLAERDHNSDTTMSSPVSPRGRRSVSRPPPLIHRPPPSSPGGPRKLAKRSATDIGSQFTSPRSPSSSGSPASSGAAPRLPASNGVVPTPRKRAV
ncbi:hypothetical protein BJ742DRAFT_767969 [Cladochytrium replicatum]|nr:hypothetical protein BJ742DRAFT_767969 [Cladochytrium replicatum]